MSIRLKFAHSLTKHVLFQVTEVPDPTVADEQALLAMQQEQLEREAEEAEMEDDEEDDD